MIHRTYLAACATTAGLLVASAAGLLAAGDGSAGSEQLAESIRQLQREMSRPPGGDQRPHSDEGIARVIAALRAMRPAAGPTTRPAEPPTPSTAPADDGTQEPTTRPALVGITLVRLRQAPLEGVADPIALGDALFMAGHLDAAATYYNLALSRRLDPNDRAWALFQVGNCQRPSDPAAARGTYRQVVAEHSQTPWSEVAAVQERLLAWYQEKTPRAFFDRLAEPVSIDVDGPAEPQPQPTTQPGAPETGEE